MTYSTFPAVPLKSELSKEVRSLATKQPLGDGYTYITQFGLHPLEETWRVRMLIKLSEAATVRSFLEARATDGKPFLWTPPDHAGGSTPMWKVEEWPIARKFQSRVEVDLLLRRIWGKLAPPGFRIGGVPHYCRAQPDFGLHPSAAYVRWVGVQWSEREYSLSDNAPPVTVNVTTGWRLLRNESGQMITYGIGGIEHALSAQTGSAGSFYSAEFYLGPWYSNIDIYVQSHSGGGGVGGTMDAFKLYVANPTEALQGFFTNSGYSYVREFSNRTNFATARGRWEFANAAYEVIFTWDGYSKLRTGAVI
jgi:phage-related protein